MEPTLLTLGVILILVGLIGQVKAKEIEVGTHNPVARVILGLIGLVFVSIALYPSILGIRPAQPTPPTASATPFSVDTETPSPSPPPTTSVPPTTEVPPTTAPPPTTEVPPTTVAPPTTIIPPTTASVEQDLLAYYTLNGTVQDSKGNYPQITIGTGTYSSDGIYCDGVAYSCVQTPPIYDLNYQNFSIGADFRVDEYPSNDMPVVVGGRSYRWIGFNLKSDGSIGLLYNNFGRSDCQGSYNLNTWYSALLTYDGHTARLYLDDQLICQESFTIEAGGGSTDKDVSTSNFSNASALRGWIRNLKIYERAITP